MLGLPWHSAAARRLPGRFTLAMLLAGLTTGLLALAGAALLEKTSAIDADPPGNCVELPVGSPHAADTHVHLENAGPDTAGVRFDWVDGLDAPTVSHGVRIAPRASADVVLRTPALGATVRFVSSGGQLHAGAEIRRDDGGYPEIRRGIPCPARAGVQQAIHAAP